VTTGPRQIRVDPESTDLPPGPPEDRPVRVMVVDDHPLWRDAIAHDLTAAGFQVVAVASDGHEALRWLPATRPDVLLLDLQLPGGLDGVEIIRRVPGLHPCHVLVLSASAEPPNVVAAVKAGASGYLLKSVSRAELLDAITRTGRGEAVFTPGLAGLVLGEYQRIAEDPGPAGPQLTQREREVLRLVALGLTSRQIADRLTISHRTVQNHTQNVLSKLQLHNRVELARYAIEKGIDGEADGDEAGS
jgi:DNA-binding NarL/FixJ family response regulator